MACHPFRPINQQKRAKAFALPAQRLSTFVRRRHEGVIPKIRQRKPYAPPVSGFGQ
jgi:hypothetical protein